MEKMRLKVVLMAIPFYGKFCNINSCYIEHVLDMTR